MLTVVLGALGEPPCSDRHPDDTERQEALTKWGEACLVYAHRLVGHERVEPLLQATGT